MFHVKQLYESSLFRLTLYIVTIITNQKRYRNYNN